MLRSNKHYNKKLQHCYNKYKEENITATILEEILSNNLLEREKYWIDKIKPDINIIEDPTLENTVCLNNGNGSKKIYQFTLDGKFLKEYPSGSEASRQTGFSKESIISVANPKNKKAKSAHGYLWSYSKNIKKYINNSSNAKNHSIYILNILTLEEHKFKKIADAARFINCGKFDTLCAKISWSCSKGLLIGNKYIARYSENKKYIYPKTNVVINKNTLEIKRNLKGIKNKEEYILITLYACEKFRESGKLHKWTTLIQEQ